MGYHELNLDTEKSVKNDLQDTYCFLLGATLRKKFLCFRVFSIFHRIFEFLGKFKKNTRISTLCAVPWRCTLFWGIQWKNGRD